MAEADRVDAAEDARYGKTKRGDELPVELARRETRLAKMAQARQSLQAQAQDKARAAAQQKPRDRGDDDDTTTAKGDQAAATATVKPTAQRNFTAPDARIMKTADGSFH